MKNEKRRSQNKGCLLIQCLLIQCFLIQCVLIQYLQAELSMRSTMSDQRFPRDRLVHTKFLFVCAPA